MGSPYPNTAQVGLEFSLLIGWWEVFKHRVVFGVERLQLEVRERKGVKSVVVCQVRDK